MSWDFGSTGSSGPSGPSASNQGWDSSSPSSAPPTRPGGYGAAPTPAPAPAPASGGSSTAGAPWVWLVAGFGVALAGIVLGILGGDLLPWGGWLLGGPVAIGLFAVFVTIDGKRRAEPWYSASTGADMGRRLLVAVCLAAVAINAYQIADHISRQGGGA